MTSLPPTIVEEDYPSFVDAVGECWIKTAMVHPEWWVKIVCVFDDLPVHFRKAALTALDSLDPNALQPEIRTKLWTGLEALVRHHQRESITLTAESQALLTVSRRLKPEEAWDAEHRLFRDLHWELGEPRYADLGQKNEKFRRQCRSCPQDARPRRRGRLDSACRGG